MRSPALRRARSAVLAIDNDSRRRGLSVHIAVGSHIGARRRRREPRTLLIRRHLGAMFDSARPAQSCCCPPRGSCRRARTHLGNSVGQHVEAEVRTVLRCHNEGCKRLDEPIRARAVCFFRIGRPRCSFDRRLLESSTASGGRLDNRGLVDRQFGGGAGLVGENGERVIVRVAVRFDGRVERGGSRNSAEVSAGCVGNAGRDDCYQPCTYIPFYRPWYPCQPLREASQPSRAWISDSHCIKAAAAAAAAPVSSTVSQRAIACLTQCSKRRGCRSCTWETASGWRSQSSLKRIRINSRSKST